MANETLKGKFYYTIRMNETGGLDCIKEMYVTHETISTLHKNDKMISLDQMDGKSISKNGMHPSMLQRT